jgi:hypothetical protein
MSVDGGHDDEPTAAPDRGSRILRRPLQQSAFDTLDKLTDEIGNVDKVDATLPQLDALLPQSSRVVRPPVVTASR